SWRNWLTGTACHGLCCGPNQRRPCISTILRAGSESTRTTSPSSTFAVERTGDGMAARQGGHANLGKTGPHQRCPAAPSALHMLPRKPLQELRPRFRRCRPSKPQAILYIHLHLVGEETVVLVPRSSRSPTLNSSSRQCKRRSHIRAIEARPTLVLRK